MSPFELDRHVHRDLRRLPSPQAPDTLLPRVLAARAKLDARPWYARAWVSWPLAWRVASSASAALMLAAVSLTASVYAADVGGWFAELSATAWRGIGHQVPAIRAGAITVGALWGGLVQPIAGYLAALALVMWAACAAFGVALTRIAGGEVSR